jgi:hypothetical protein
MKASRATLALCAGLIVSAGAIYEANATHADSCQYLARAAGQAAQAPILPNAASQLGFVPMSQFEKVYAPVCQPRDANADLFSSLVAGAFIAVACYFGLSVAARFKPKH